MPNIALHLTLKRTINRKWPMGYQMVTCPMTSRDPKGAVRQYGRLSKRAKIDRSRSRLTR